MVTRGQIAAKCAPKTVRSVMQAFVSCANQVHICLMDSASYQDFYVKPQTPIRGATNALAT